MNYFEKKPKKNYGFIYKYTSPSGKEYIGQTVRSMKERAISMSGIGYRDCRIFFNAIKKYGFENFQLEILEEVPIQNLDDREKYWIKYYNTIIPNGYNATDGGKGYQIKQGKMRSNKIDQYDLDGNFIKTYNSLREAADDNHTTYQAISAVLTRRRKQHNGFIYRYNNEFPPMPVTVQKTYGRLTAQYDLNGNFIAIYSSAIKAALAIGKNTNAGRNIRAVCEGKRNTAYGFKWKYLD